MHGTGEKCYLGIPIPENETLRIDALKRYDILDTPPDAAFDRITRIAAAYLNVPIALVSLVDETRQWFKSHHGLEVTETPRDIAFCAHAIMGDAVMVVPDATGDPRFADNPLVTGEPGVRFYAGAPLRTRDGFNLGTLCAIDRVPGNLTGEQLGILDDLACLIIDELELRIAGKRAMEGAVRSARAEEALREAHEQTRAIVDNVIDGIIAIRADGTIETFNAAAENLFGYAREEVIGNNVKMLMPEPVAVEHDRYIQNYVDTGEARIIGIGREVEGMRKDGAPFP